MPFIASVSQQLTIDCGSLRRMVCCLSRRQLLLGAVVSGIAPTTGFIRAQSAEQLTLRAAAERAGLFWGAAVQSSQIKPETDFAALVARECSVVVPEWEMKWSALEPKQGQPRYGPADAIVKFAKQRQLKIRGHALVWHRSMPKWARETIKQKSDWDVLASLITHTP